MNYYAQPRMTRDIDIVVALTGNDVRQIMATFGTEYYIPEETLVTAVSTATIFNLIHLESVVKVDIIVRKADEYRRHEFDRRMAVEIAGFKTWIVSKEDLILSKLHWAIEYIRKWAKRLGIDILLKECLHE